MGAKAEAALAAAEEAVALAQVRAVVSSAAQEDHAQAQAAAAAAEEHIGRLAAKGNEWAAWEVAALEAREAAAATSRRTWRRSESPWRQDLGRQDLGRQGLGRRRREVQEEVAGARARPTEAARAAPTEPWGKDRGGADSPARGGAVARLGRRRRPTRTSGGAPRGQQKREQRGRRGLAGAVVGAWAAALDEAKREAKVGGKAEAARATRPEVMAAVREEGGSAAAALAEAAHKAAARTLVEALTRAKAARKDAAAAVAEEAARLTEGPRTQLGQAMPAAAEEALALARAVRAVVSAAAQEDHAQAQAAAAAAEEEHTGDGPRALIGETPGSAAARGQTVAPQATNGLREE